MSLAKRIIPCLDVDNGRVVKGVQFVDIRDAGDPVEIAKRYDQQGAYELTFLDIPATSDNRDTIKSRLTQPPFLIQALCKKPVKPLAHNVL